jgi:tRNA(Ile2) C34 agmatinyltransferase TiaS
MKNDEYGVLICNFCGTRRKSQLTRLEYNCYKCGEPIVDAVVRSKKRDEEKETKRKEREAKLRYVMTGQR